MIHPAASRGFTLTELIIAVAVVGILAAIALPSYTTQIARSNRSAAQKELLQLVSMQEIRFLRARGYGNTMDQVLRTATAGSLNYYINAKGRPTTVAAGDAAYLITLERAGSPARYTGFSAVAVGQQLTRDPSCVRIEVQSNGQRTAANGSGTDTTSACWSG